VDAAALAVLEHLDEAPADLLDPTTCSFCGMMLQDEPRRLVLLVDESKPRWFRAGTGRTCTLCYFKVSEVLAGLLGSLRSGS
jgi:nitrous oxide reductase accessory protein NosL